MLPWICNPCGLPWPDFPWSYRYSDFFKLTHVCVSNGHASALQTVQPVQGGPPGAHTKNIHTANYQIFPGMSWQTMPLNTPSTKPTQWGCEYLGEHQRPSKLTGQDHGEVRGSARHKRKAGHRSEPQKQFSLWSPVQDTKNTVLGNLLKSSPSPAGLVLWFFRAMTDFCWHDLRLLRQQGADDSFQDTWYWKHRV